MDELYKIGGCIEPAREANKMEKSEYFIMQHALLLAGYIFQKQDFISLFKLGLRSFSLKGNLAPLTVSSDRENPDLVNKESV